MVSQSLNMLMWLLTSSALPAAVSNLTGTLLLSLRICWSSRLQLRQHYPEAAGCSVCCACRLNLLLLCRCDVVLSLYTLLLTCALAGHAGCR
jgi:hypothetical protein